MSNITEIFQRDYRERLHEGEDYLGLAVEVTKRDDLSDSQKEDLARYILDFGAGFVMGRVEKLVDIKHDIGLSMIRDYKSKGLTEHDYDVLEALIEGFQAVELQIWQG